MRNWCNDYAHEKGKLLVGWGGLFHCHFVHYKSLTGLLRNLKMENLGRERRSVGKFTFISKTLWLNV